MRKILFGFAVVAMCVGLLWIGTTGTANAQDGREGRLTSALESDARDRIRCEGRLHACFPGQGNLDDLFPPSVTPRICLETCDNRSSNDNACNESDCFRRCLVAHNLTAIGDTVCE